MSYTPAPTCEMEDGRISASMARVCVHVSDRSAGDENDFSDSAVRKPDRTFADQSYDKPAFLSRRRKLDGYFSLLVLWIQLIVFFFFRAP